MNNPIIKSRLDNDYYQYTVGQLVHKEFPTALVVYEFKHRTKQNRGIEVRLADFIDEQELRDELNHVQTLKLTSAEYLYLRSLGLFSKDYLDFLYNLSLPNYELKKIDGQLSLRFHGKWSEVIYWETPALAIINELYYRNLTKNVSAEAINTIGNNKLDEKIIKIIKNPNITFSEFGTRRRFSREWQEHLVVDKLHANISPKQFIGTSNLDLARRFGLKPIGTMSHQLFMGLQGLRTYHIRESHNEVLQLWWKHYGYDLSIALTDTYGSGFFFRDMTYEQARDWKGLRQDSGNPFEFANNAIQFYTRYGIDPKEKLIISSDGLDIQTMDSLEKVFGKEIQVSFGWGTNLTNDLGFTPLSIVIKLVKSDGFSTVKLSDNPAKATGSPEDIERFKKIFDYQPQNYEECVY